MEEGKHQPSGLQDLMDAGYYGDNQGLGQIIYRIPEDNHVEYAAGEVEVAVKEAIDIEPRLLPGFAGNHPFRLGCFFYDVCHVDAVAEVGDVVDVGGGGGPNVEDPQ
jgi:hypothetical protein